MKVTGDGLLGAGMGLVSSIFGGNQQKKAEERQDQRQKEYMALQHGYNEESADNAQKRTMAMWDYTNYENQMKHMKAAGLNPALMYGLGGGGGVSANGAQGVGTSMPTDQAGSLGIQEKGMALETAQLMSQIELNKATAKKTDAEANKIAGVDTDATKAGIENVIAQTANEKVKKGLIYADTRLKDAMEELNRAKVEETGWAIKNIVKGIEYMDAQIKQTGLNSELIEKTMDSQVNEAAARVQNIIADTLLKGTQGRVNQEQAKAIGEQVKQGWENVLVNLKGKENEAYALELEAEKIMNQLNLGKMEIDQKEKNRIKDYIMGIGEILVGGLKRSK